MTTTRPMLPPLDTSRRGFLTNAAALAAAGTAIALTASGGPANAAAARATQSASVAAAEIIDPLFIETRDDIHDKLSEWLKVNAECKIRDRAVLEWEQRNPMPDFRLPGDEGYSPTYRSDWHARRQNALRQARLHPVKSRRNELDGAYHRAVNEFAAMEARNLSELLFKVETGMMMDSSCGTIAMSVLQDIDRLRDLGDFRYQMQVVA